MPRRGGPRFAFYGRASTEDYQDPVTSRVRQLGLAAGLVAGFGRIVAEFFDAGQSRTLPWARRPEAAPLVAAMADPDRGFDAIVVGEYDRAFLRRPVRPDGSVVRALRGPAMDPGGRGPVDSTPTVTSC
jgi:site-specific DNA recombinase